MGKIKEQLESQTEQEALLSQFQLMRSAHLADSMPDLDTRRNRLRRLLTGLEALEDDFTQTISEDFGHRSAFETANYDFTITIGDIKHQLRNVDDWMRPRRRSVPLHLLPGRARLLPQPLGVVGVISPWNFPLFLSITPVAGALAAGNRVMLKPSEFTSGTSKLLAELAAECFETDEFTVAVGGVETGKFFIVTLRSFTLHRFHTSRTRGGKGDGREPDADYAGTGWQVTCHRLSQCRPETGRQPDRLRQAGQCRTGLHLSRLCFR